MTQTLPLTWGDESVLHLESASEPCNSQMEIGDTQRIDPTELEAAVHAACMAHPIARSRLVLGAAHQRFDHWEIVDDLIPMSIPVVDCPDDATLARLRTDFYSPPFPAHEAPTFRVQVARRPHGDLVQIKAAHAAIDGIGLWRLGRSITDAYRGKPEPPSPLPLEEARDLKRQLRPKSFSERAARALEGGRKLKDAAIPPARVAPDTTDSRTGPGFAHRTIEAEQLAELNARRPKGTTFNDMLIGAVGIAVQEWNRQHNVDANKIIGVRARQPAARRMVYRRRHQHVFLLQRVDDAPRSDRSCVRSQSRCRANGPDPTRGSRTRRARPAAVGLPAPARRQEAYAPTAQAHRKQVQIRRYCRGVLYGQPQGADVVLWRLHQRVLRHVPVLGRCGGIGFRDSRGQHSVSRPAASPQYIGRSSRKSVGGPARCHAH